MTRRTNLGFTLIELMVVVAVVGVLATLAVTTFGRQKPRQTLDNQALELRSLLHGARQTALTTGQPVVVMLFPDYAVGTPSIGRLIVYQDGAGSFFQTAAAVNFDNVSVAQPVAGPGSEVLDRLDLPFGVIVGPTAGQGAGAVMPPPFAGIAIDKACGFCTGANRRGAIVFDPGGSASFYDRAGAPLALPAGASFSLTSADAAEVRTLVVAAPTGALTTLKWKP